MLAAVKMLGMLTVMFVPGGLVVLCAYFFARALHQTWLRERAVSEGSVSLRRVVAGVRFRDVVAEARRSF